jgi:hypothetical protein
MKRLACGVLFVAAAVAQVPDRSRVTIPASHGGFSVSFDPRIWSHTGAETGRQMFAASTGQAWAVLISETARNPNSAMPGIVLNNARRIDANARVLASEARSQGGAQMHRIVLSYAYRGVPYISLGHYHAGPAGTVQLVCFAGLDQFARHLSSHCEALLAGLQVGEQRAAAPAPADQSDGGLVATADIDMALRVIARNTRRLPGLLPGSSIETGPGPFSEVDAMILYALKFHGKTGKCAPVPMVEQALGKVKDSPVHKGAGLRFWNIHCSRAAVAPARPEALRQAFEMYILEKAIQRGKVANRRLEAAVTADEAWRKVMQSENERQGRIAERAGTAQDFRELYRKQWEVDELARVLAKVCNSARTRSVYITKEEAPNLPPMQ